MKKHLALVLMAQIGFGVQVAVQGLWAKAGMEPIEAGAIIIVGLGFWYFVLFTSLPKVKAALKEWETTDKLKDFPEANEAEIKTEKQ